ncbi:hypothetical protein CEXT_48291 [Caerostris extrusa]|uniref:Uncharacterized protein n=1 Tax=Caerostris extrusa TaxID=172846 RepID=A0AAV4N3S7_CAEEX|nr:hypothetical protein CEXT_48291 [Caerostris extrusa]
MVESMTCILNCRIITAIYSMITSVFLFSKFCWNQYEILDSSIAWRQNLSDEVQQRDQRKGTPIHNDCATPDKENVLIVFSLACQPLGTPL